ncbi:MAG: hypothetical protein ACOH2M_31040 [Cypionkella sp.]
MTATTTNMDRLAALRKQRQDELMNSPEVKLLQASDQLKVALEILAKRKRPERKKWDRHTQISLNVWVFQKVRQCLADPDLAETMTAKERRDRAEAIKFHSESLWNLVAPFMRGSQQGFGWPFQPELDYLALDLSIDHIDSYQLPPEECEDAQRASRSAIYYVLMNRIEDVLSTLIACGERFQETDTVIKKPNDRNAKRLYFLRVLTSSLSAEFGSPCRGAALALASVYFDCSDLDEASISKLAPVKRPHPVEIPVSRLKEFAASVEERLASIGESDPEKAEELQYYLNFYRELISKSSA